MVALGKTRRRTPVRTLAQSARADGASGGVALYNRLTAVTYPNGRVVYYNYPSSGSIGAALSRLDNIAASATPSSADIYAQYTYLGAGTIVRVDHPAVEDGLTLSYVEYDQYDVPTFSGWDRFGRVIQQTWTVDDTPVDSYAYAYDMNSNRLYRENQLTTGLDELYSYDDLNRLTNMERGDLDVTKTFVSNSAFVQGWTLDQLGNWTGLNDNGTTQTRTFNGVNEITGITDSRGWIVPIYDAAGNMISGPTSGDEDARQHYTYDAWNRLVKVYADDDGDPGALIATYVYDAQTRRIRKTVEGSPDVTYDYYYNESWQELEARKDGDPDPQEQYVWDIRYIDAPVVRFFDGNTDGDYADLNTLDENEELVIGVDSILYYCNDANMNTTALVDGAAVQSSVTAGQVVERNTYTAYGKPEVRDTDWNLQTYGSAYMNWSLFASYHFDDETGLYLVRNRVYQAELGRWGQRDPIQYGDGTSLYQYAGTNPVAYVDATGMALEGPSYSGNADFLGGLMKSAQSTQEQLVTQARAATFVALKEFEDFRMKAPVITASTGLPVLLVSLRNMLDIFPGKLNAARPGTEGGFVLDPPNWFRWQATVDGNDVFHETIHALDFARRWYAPDRGGKAEELAWGALAVDWALGQIARVESFARDHTQDSALASRWDSLWKEIAHGWSGNTVTSPAKVVYQVTEPILHDVAEKLRFRVSCSKIREALIAAYPQVNQDCIVCPSGYVIKPEELHAHERQAGMRAGYFPLPEVFQ